MISKIIKFHITYAKIACKDVKEIAPLIIQGGYLLSVYAFSSTQGFAKISLQHKNFTSISITDGLKDTLKERYRNSILIISNIDYYITSDTIKYMVEDLFIELEETYKKNKTHLILLGEYNKLSKTILDKFISLSIPNEIIKNRKEFIAVNFEGYPDFINMTITQLNNLLIQKKLYPNENIRTLKNNLIGHSILELLPNLVSFNDIGGRKKEKEYLKKIISVWGNPNWKFQKPRGILLKGKSGSGKTMLAKAIALEMGLPLYRVDMGLLYNRYLGKTEEKVRELWEDIKLYSPAVILFDEIEKMLSGSSSSDDSDAGTTGRVMSYMLYQFQEQATGNFLIGTINNIQRLPPEFFRLGRWDKIFDLSNLEEEKILEVVAKKYSITFNDKERVKGKTGAEIDNYIYNLKLMEENKNEHRNT